MSTVPKGSTDNYSKHVKKIDDKGNLKAHPRLMKKKKSARQKMLEYEASLPKATPKREDMAYSSPPKMSKVEKMAGAIGKALSSGVEKVRRKVDYDPDDRTTYKKRY